MLPRATRQSMGYLACQFFQNADLITAAAYNETNRPILYGARYEWVKDGSNPIPILRTVADTDGPIGGWIAWKPKSPRVVAQLGMIFPTKITSTGKATPVSTGDGSGWTLSTDLDEMDVYTKDGSSPSVGTFGVVIAGTILNEQKLLFFEGGGGGAASKIFKITDTTDAPDGHYVGREYDFPGGTEVAAVDVDLYEMNEAPAVPADHWVEATLRGDDYWFHEPLGCEDPEE